ncbi:MAG TPA: hypothetical protein VKK81_11495 [Candidatus Binatia bacterium]|nr:hypothetical protein [Candidatus Binatia bacterium]
MLAYQALELPTRRWKRDIELVLAAVEKALGRPQVNSTSVAAVKVGENLDIEDVQAGDLAGIKGNKVPSGMSQIEVGKAARLKRSKLGDIVGVKITGRGEH